MSDETNEVVEEVKEEVSSATEAKDDKKEAKAEKKESKSAGKEVQKLVDEIKKLKLTEVAELVSALEDEFGVSAAMPMMAGPVAGGAAGGDAAAGGEEKSSFNVELTSGGEQKIAVIKAIREVIPELGLKEAKDLVDGAPKVIKENVKKEDAENMKKKLEEAGGKVTLK